MAALNSRPRSPRTPRTPRSPRTPRTPRSRLPRIEPFGPLRFNRSKFFTFRHDELDIPLQDGPVSRAELSREVHMYETIMYRKYPGRVSKSFCRGSEGISVHYLMARVQAHASQKDAVVYYYDTAHPETYEDDVSSMRSNVGGIMTIQVKPNCLHITGWCIPSKNSDGAKGKGKGLGHDFIRILVEIAQTNNKERVTLECYGDELRALYERKDFHVIGHEVEYNSNNSNHEETIKYTMEFIVPEIKRRVRYRTKSANFTRQNQRQRSGSRKTLKYSHKSI
jgi:hypothetical protein